VRSPASAEADDRENCPLRSGSQMMAIDTFMVLVGVHDELDAAEG
jgi:hypothetical protein